MLQTLLIQLDVYTRGCVAPVSGLRTHSCGLLQKAFCVYCHPKTDPSQGWRQTFQQEFLDTLKHRHRLVSRATHHSTAVACHAAFTVGLQRTKTLGSVTPGPVSETSHPKSSPHTHPRSRLTPTRAAVPSQPRDPTSRLQVSFYPLEIPPQDPRLHVTPCVIGWDPSAVPSQPRDPTSRPQT